MSGLGAPLVLTGEDDGLSEEAKDQAQFEGWIAERLAEVTDMDTVESKEYAATIFSASQDDGGLTAQADIWSATTERTRRDAINLADDEMSAWEGE